MVKTSFVGFLLVEGCLKFDLTTIFLFSMVILLSLREVFGRIRLH